MPLPTIEEVEQAYKETGLKGTRRKWTDGETCGCALTAVAVHRGLCTLTEVYKMAKEDDVTDYMAHLFGVDEFEVTRFTMGFDEYASGAYSTSEPLWQLGLSAFKRLEELGIEFVKPHEIEDVETGDEG